MADNHEGEPTQRTEKGLEIPVPKREDVFKAFEKVAKTPDPADKRKPQSPAEGA